MSVIRCMVAALGFAFVVSLLALVIPRAVQTVRCEDRGGFATPPASLLAPMVCTR